MISKKIKLTVVLLWLSAISMPVFAWLDTMIQHIWESLRPKESFENLNKWFTFGNIYANAHNIASKEFLATTAQALGNMTDDLNYTYNCNLDINQVSNILLTIDSTRNDIQAMAKTIKEATPKFEQDNFIWSCTKLVNCVTKWNNGTSSLYWYSNWQGTGQKWTYLSDDWFLNCKRLATNAYKRNIQSTESSVTLASTNAWNDIYYNGTLDDSPYDILVDIQRIWDILFDNNEQTEKVLFYTFPNNSIAGFQAVPFDGSSRTTPFGASTQLWWNNTNAQWRNINTAGNNITNSNTTFPSANTNRWNTTNVWSSQWWYNNTKPITVTTPDKPTYIDTSNTITDAGIIDNYACTPEQWWGQGWDTGTIDTDEQDTWWSDDWTSDNETSDDWEEINPPLVFDVNTPYYSPIVGTNDDPIANIETLEDPEQYEQQAAQIESCTANCKWLKAIDKSMCIAKCMCGTTYTKNWMFGLSICTIPTKQTDIVSSKSVQSIEEIVSEINNVLKNLKQSGEMMKHTKTKEFLDTSLSKIKLGKIFAFDVSISFKPILDTKPRKMTDAEAENETDTILKGTYGSIDIWAEKNKYLVFWIDSKQEVKDNTSSISLQEIQNTITNEEAKYVSRYTEIEKKLTKEVAASQNAEVADIVRQFLEQNVRFWTFVHESLDQIQQTSSDIKQKIEKGK